jgi:hypothetical protein
VAIVHKKNIAFDLQAQFMGDKIFSERLRICEMWAHALILWTIDRPERQLRLMPIPCGSNRVALMAITKKIGFVQKPSF